MCASLCSVFTYSHIHIKQDTEKSKYIYIHVIEMDLAVSNQIH